MNDQNSTEAGSDLNRMVELIYGFVPSQAIAVAATLGLADLLEKGPKSVEELASATKTHAPSLNRLLRMLTSLLTFAYHSDNCA